MPSCRLQLKAEALDVSLPGRQRGQGGLHPVSLHAGAHRGHFRLHGFRRGRRPRDRDRLVQLHRAEHAGRPPGAFDARHLLRRRRHATGPNLLRTHTSPMQMRHAVQHVKKHRALLDAGQAMPEIRVIAPGRTYRVDSDATHSPMFHQCEGLWIGENVSFKDLKVVFTDFCRTFFESDDLVLRFPPQLLPVHRAQRRDRHPVPERPAGRPLAGGGRLRPGAPNVVRNMGLDPERYIGFAFGMGPDRLTMLRYGVNDLRLFFDGDIRFLSQFNAKK
jgi:phenylalanyl-tRNA synthetase alpha chain